jgi:hypothetical protein
MLININLPGMVLASGEFMQMDEECKHSWEGWRPTFLGRVSKMI